MSGEAFQARLKRNLPGFLRQGLTTYARLSLNCDPPDSASGVHHNAQLNLIFEGILFSLDQTSNMSVAMF
jgi:hypothetical protein